MCVQPELLNTLSGNAMKVNSDDLGKWGEGVDSEKLRQELIDV